MPLGESFDGGSKNEFYLSQIKIKFNFLFTGISNEGLKMCVAGERRLLLIFI